MTRQTLRLILPFLAVAGLLGCDPSQNAGSGSTASNASSSGEIENKDDLEEFYRVYLDHHDVHREGPASWEAALEFARQSDNYDPAALERLRSAGCQVRWSGKVQEAVDGADNYIIAEMPGGQKLAISGVVHQ